MIVPGDWTEWQLIKQRDPDNKDWLVAQVALRRT